MKKLLLLAYLFPLFVSAQHCFSKTDEFTGKPLKVGMVSLIPFTDLTMPLFTFSKSDTVNRIGFAFQADVSKDNFSADKMLMMVKFEDGNVKKYYSDDLTKVTIISGLTTVSFYSIISKEDLFYFKDHSVAFIRISYKGDESYGFDNKIKSNKAKQIMEAVNCILN